MASAAVLAAASFIIAEVAVVAAGTAEAFWLIKTIDAANKAIKVFRVV